MWPNCKLQNANCKLGRVLWVVASLIVTAIGGTITFAADPQPPARASETSR